MALRIIKTEVSYIRISVWLIHATLALVFRWCMYMLWSSAQSLVQPDQEVYIQLWIFTNIKICTGLAYVLFDWYTSILAHSFLNLTWFALRIIRFSIEFFFIQDVAGGQQEHNDGEYCNLRWDKIAGMWYRMVRLEQIANPNKSKVKKRATPQIDRWKMFIYAHVHYIILKIDIGT